MSARGCALLRLTTTEHVDTPIRPGPVRAGVASITCLLRSLPLFFCATPQTPLRVLCIVALDTIHVIRHSQPLSRHERKQLATFLDFQAWTNAAWDRKPLCVSEYQALQHRLETAGLGSWIIEYLTRLRELETRRPSVGGDRRHFNDVRSYREAVVRLSLATIAGIAMNATCLDEGIRATHGDRDTTTLFRIAMQCQIIDDVVDYRKDLCAGLPSFLTASASLSQALALTVEASRSYASGENNDLFPLRVALSVVSATTKIVAGVARTLYGVGMH